LNRHSRTRHRWENNIKMGLKLTGFECVARVQPPQDRAQWRLPVDSNVSFSRRTVLCGVSYKLSIIIKSGLSFEGDVSFRLTAVAVS
jgi:hypothetical protein